MSKRKKCLYEKLLKTGTQKSEGDYKHYKQLYEQVNKNKRGCNKRCYRQKKSYRQIFPIKINLDKKIITCTISTAEIFNKFSTEIGPVLANEIRPSSASFNT